LVSEHRQNHTPSKLLFNRSQGTGKGMFVEKIIFPMFNEEGDVVKMSKEECTKKGGKAAS
jgi:hypothetical protein